MAQRGIGASWLSDSVRVDGFNDTRDVREVSMIRVAFAIVIGGYVATDLLMFDERRRS